MTHESIFVRAIVRLLPTAEGGRASPIRGSYRPNHNFFWPSDRGMAIGFIDLPEGVELHPGDSIETSIRFMEWSALAGQLYPGREWRIQEGATLVGFGTIIEITPQV